MPSKLPHVAAYNASVSAAGNALYDAPIVTTPAAPLPFHLQSPLMRPLTVPDVYEYFISYFTFSIFDFGLNVERDFTLSLKQRIDYYFLLRVNQSFEPRNTPGWQLTCVSSLSFKMPLASL